MTTTTLTSHVAGLAGDNEQVISGVAVGVDDVTRGLSGDQKVWTAEELRAAAASLEGTPVNPLHSEQDVGEVVRAGFDPERGVIYEAELKDDALAKQASNGSLEVSIEARHSDGGAVETDQGEAMLATDIQFTGLSLVQRGAAPSASAEAGEAAALSATAIHAELAENAEMAYEKDETANMADVPDEYVFDNPGEAVSKAQEMGLDGAADEVIHTHNEGEDTVFMPAASHEDLMDMIRDESGAMADVATDDAVSPSNGQAEAGGERTDTETTEHNANMDDNEEEEFRARLSEKDDRIAELENQVEQLEDEREQVARAYAEALAAGDTVFDEDDLVEKFEVAELRERFENIEDATLAETEPTVQSGDSGSETATLSDSEEEQVAEHREVIADLAGSEKMIAQKERERRAALVAEKTGEDAETVLEQEA